MTALLLTKETIKKHTFFNVPQSSHRFVCLVNVGRLVNVGCLVNMGWCVGGGG